MTRPKIAICPRNTSFTDRWIPYCQSVDIPCKIVDCDDNDIIAQMEDCDGLMWHWSHTDPRALQYARQLTYSLEAAGKRVFPDSKTCWHFDDKVGQKYLLEAIEAPLVPSYVFYDATKALEWAQDTSYPKVFKLRNGAGSSNVRLVRSFGQARMLIKRAFGRGFSPIGRTSVFMDKWRNFKSSPSQTGLINLGKSAVRLLVRSYTERVLQRQIGYAYFQDYVPDSTFDIRVIVIGDMAFALKRLIRPDDFRASGSGRIVYTAEEIPRECLQISYELTRILGAQIVCYDYVQTPQGQWVILEISYGFVKEVYDACEGYWTKDLVHHPGTIHPQQAMVDQFYASLNTDRNE